MSMELFDSKHAGMKLSAGGVFPLIGLKLNDTPETWVSADEPAVHGFVRIMAEPKVIPSEVLGYLAHKAEDKTDPGYGKLASFSGVENLVKESRAFAEQEETTPDLMSLSMDRFIALARTIKVPDVPSPYGAKTPAAARGTAGNVRQREAVQPARGAAEPARAAPRADSGQSQNGVNSFFAGKKQSLQSCTRGPCNWNDAVAYCRQGGRRLPTVNELLKLFHSAPAGASWASKKWYWSSEEVSPSVVRAVYFENDLVREYDKSHIFKERFEFPPVCVK